ncbi:MAG: pyridoxal-phosphate dependent enzyme [Sulfolobales archaeon]|nr:pyridoxal-phosphate dependent enzyme [Sulfolobales archaeon]MCX8208967.1 pyridoxal-phosphate dependent enzyme [Sulfolobales archaeon]MDW8010692.1 pyridoxal-phosphate dependent enzyme [Sulfolobales archaeon]
MRISTSYGRRTYALKCWRCGLELDTLSTNHTCSRCGEPLFAEVNLGEISRRGIESLVLRELKKVTLGEGRTPLIDHGRFLLKLEFLNPTGSFKDRGAALTISRALAASWRTVIEDSSGNAGIATAAYSARAGIKARIYAPADAPAGKLRLIKAFGAELRTVKTRDEAHKAALEDRSGVYVGHVVEPFFIEGIKDVALELVKSGSEFEVVVVPVASGTLFLGLYKGFKELVELGHIDEVPTLIPVEACGYSKLSRYLKSVSLACAEGERSVLADALRLTIVPRLQQIARAAGEVSPYVVTVGDEAIGESMRELYSMGLPVEPSCAAVYAAAKYVARDFSGRVVVPLTGSGLKYVPVPNELIDKYLF